MANNRPNREPRDNREPREFFTLGEHTYNGRKLRFQYDGRLYRIVEVRGDGEDETETAIYEEAVAEKAYDAWNHIKRPERFGGIVVMPSAPVKSEETEA